MYVCTVYGYTASATYGIKAYDRQGTLNLTPHTIFNRKAESLKLFMLSYVHVYFCMCPCVYMFSHMSRTYTSTCSSFNSVPIMACKILVEVQANYKLCAKTAVPTLNNYGMD